MSILNPYLTASIVNIELGFADLAASLNPQSLLAVWPAALSPSKARTPREAKAAAAYKRAMDQHFATAPKAKPALKLVASAPRPAPHKPVALRPRRGRRSQP